VFGYYFSALLVIIFSCTPINASWDTIAAADPGTRCVNRPIFYFTQAGFGIATDLTIILTPQATIWKFNMPFRRRISLMVIFAVGLL